MLQKFYRWVSIPNLHSFKNIFVKNKEDLKKAFDEIRLSSKDSLEFLV